VAEPGTIRPSALPANWAHAIGNHPFEANAIRSSSHRQNELATSKRSTRTAKGESRCSSERQEKKTEIRPGRRRYSDTAVTARRTADLTYCRRVAAGIGGGTCDRSEDPSCGSVIRAVWQRPAQRCGRCALPIVPRHPATMREWLKDVSMTDRPIRPTSGGEMAETGSSGSPSTAVAGGGPTAHRNRLNPLPHPALAG